MKDEEQNPFSTKSTTIIVYSFYARQIFGHKRVMDSIEDTLSHHTRTRPKDDC